MSTNPTALLNGSTSLESAQAIVLASSEAQAEHLNENLKSIYLTAFNNWKISVDAGRIDNSNPPKPPKAFVVKMDPASGFSFPESGDQPVCDMPPIPASNVGPGTGLQSLLPNMIDIGADLGGSFYAAGPTDTWPPNKKTPPVTLPDGTTHVFQKIPAPVGTVTVTLPDGTVVLHGGWYEIAS